MTYRVCVFCASSEAVSAELRRVAAELGRELAARGWELVYGGGNVGLMGEVARAALSAHGEVLGVIPHRLVEHEFALDGLTRLMRTDTMRERKDLMDAHSDAFVVLPGGIGTLEELLEIITLKQLGYHARAIVLLDPDGFWDPLLAQLTRIVDRRFARPDLAALWTVTRDVPATMAYLDEYEAPALRRPAPVEAGEAVADAGSPQDTSFSAPVDGRSA
ncbi:MAG: TIGR00730 family Rossman fold protein [Egibacteraceae bacterium]